MLSVSGIAYTHNFATRAAGVNGGREGSVSPSEERVLIYSRFFILLRWKKTGEKYEMEFNVIAHYTT